MRLRRKCNVINILFIVQDIAIFGFCHCCWRSILVVMTFAEVTDLNNFLEMCMEIFIVFVAAVNLTLMETDSLLLILLDEMFKQCQIYILSKGCLYRTLSQNQVEVDNGH